MGLLFKTNKKIVRLRTATRAEIEAIADAGTFRLVEVLMAETPEETERIDTWEFEINGGKFTCQSDTNNGENEFYAFRTDLTQLSKMLGTSPDNQPETPNES